MKLFINILFCIIAAILVYSSPEKFDYDFCVIIFIIFIIHNLYYFSINKSVNRNGANFDFFFMFSYGMVNFIYPVFYKLSNPYILMFDLPFNQHVISKSTAIAYLGYAFYLLGSTPYRKATKEPVLKRESLPSFKVNNRFVRLLFAIALFSFAGYISTGGLTELQKVYSGVGGNLNNVGIYSYFNNIFVICTLLLAIFVFLVDDRKLKLATFSFLIFCSLLLLTTGSRTTVLGVGLIMISVFGRYIRRISHAQLSILVIVGALFMSLIMLTRSVEFSVDNWTQSASKNAEFDSPLDVFIDLIANNRNLYVLVDFADDRGFVYLVSAIADLTAPFPGLSKYIQESMNVPPELIIGGGLPTFLEFGTGSDWGLGTNLVGEAYVGFGYYGVCIIMFFIGLAVKSSYKNSEKNVYAFVIYYLLVSHAIFFPRAFYLYQPRTLVWSLLIVFVLLRVTNAHRKQNRHKTLSGN